MSQAIDSDCADEECWFCGPTCCPTCLDCTCHVMRNMDGTPVPNLAPLFKVTQSGDFFKPTQSWIKDE